MTKKQQKPTQEIEIGSKEDTRPLLIKPSKLKQVKYLRDSQKDLANMIKEKRITFVIAEAGTAKTYISMHTLLSLMLQKDEDGDYTYNKIVVIRSIIESTESLGFLPGDLATKVAPYLQVFYETIDEIMGHKSSFNLVEHGLLTNQIIAFLRGKSLKKSLIIVDEAQNLNLDQFKLILSRIGYKSKMVICGDSKQIDIKAANSYLERVATLLSSMKDVGVHRFKPEDQMREPIITKIIEHLESFNAK